MNWQSIGTRHFAHPYFIVPEVRGFSAWIMDETRHENLGKEIKTLDEAKHICLKHSLQAVDVK
jgi:hypothetical protein